MDEMELIFRQQYAEYLKQVKAGNEERAAQHRTLSNLVSPMDYGSWVSHCGNDTLIAKLQAENAALADRAKTLAAALEEITSYKASDWLPIEMQTIAREALKADAALKTGGEE